VTNRMRPAVVWMISDSSMTTAGRIVFVTTRCCNYSLFELLMMGEHFTQNMESSLQRIKYCTKSVILLEHFNVEEWRLGNSYKYEGDPKSKVSIMLGLQANCSRDCWPHCCVCWFPHSQTSRRCKKIEECSNFKMMYQLLKINVSFYF
jgi:hypothetical protein